MIHEGVSDNVPKDSVQCSLYSNEHMNTIESLGTSAQVFKPTMNTNEHMNTNYSELRKNLLASYRLKQQFRVSIGKSKWINYESFNEQYNLREILNDEVVIEFDTPDQNIVVPAISQTGINLVNARYTFEYWDHGGKSPHLHIHDLPIAHLEPSKRSLFKKMFIKKYVPEEYHKYVDLSLTGVHLVAIEWANHWKGCYGVKKLINTFAPAPVPEPIQTNESTEDIYKHYSKDEMDWWCNWIKQPYNKKWQFKDYGDYVITPTPTKVIPDKELKDYLDSKGIEFHSTSELLTSTYYPKDLEVYHKEYTWTVQQ